VQQREPLPFAPQAAPAVAQQPAPSGLDRSAAAVLDRNTRIQGTLNSQGNVLVEGSFEGDMDARETILIEKEASAKGHFLAKDVIVSGSFDGEAVCQGQFRVTPSGSVTGQINTRVLVIEEGSTVNCRFSMTRERR
jgi:cytoskeletal protein CcmA (bactofilin family)